MPKLGSQLIIWTDEERRNLIDWTFEAMLEDPKLSLLHCLSKAQKNLPANRRRDIRAVRTVKWLADEVEARFVEMRRRAEAPPPPPAVVEKEPSPVNPRELVLGLPPDILLVALLNWFKEQHEEMRERVTNIEGMLRRITGDVRQAASTPPPTAMPPAPEAPPAKPAKLRVAVIGPDAQQGSHIKSKCQGRASVEIVDRSQKGKKFPDVDYVIITRHADHNWYEAAHAAMK
ncbi:MAG: hypothetical protein IRY99_12265, partial [Isosphaeraceae bacterium]|nr:hypothetical protein [Isosphaeraceae bacterium]